MKLRALLLSTALPLSATPALADVAPEPKPAHDKDKDHGKGHDKDHKPQLPAHLKGKAELLAPDDKDYARADLASAVKPAGDGGLVEGMVVRLTADVPVWRMWSGPAKKDARGNTNRLGQWWSYDAPHGPQQKYRTDYEICQAWNDLTWVAKCTLKKGAVVAIGPGQSVSAKTCGDPAGKEEYAANKHDWQLWLAKAWARLGPDKELDCPTDSADYEADPGNIAKPKAAAAAPAPAPAK